MLMSEVLSVKSLCHKCTNLHTPVVGDVIGDGVEPGVLVVDEPDGLHRRRRPLRAAAARQERLRTERDPVVLGFR